LFLEAAKRAFFLTEGNSEGLPSLGRTEFFFPLPAQLARRRGRKPLELVSVKISQTFCVRDAKILRSTSVKGQK